MPYSEDYSVEILVISQRKQMGAPRIDKEE
jgi:hypothetical protein